MTSAPTQFGALPFPVPNPDVGEAASDPGLDVLLSFAQAVIVARCGETWRRIGGDTGEVVKITRAHNPAERVVIERQFPALFGWRTRGVFETIADDFDTELSTLTLLWVFPPAQSENQRIRGPIVNGVAKALGAGLMRGRDPAWVVPGDTEAQAARNGSFLWSWAGWFAVETRPTSKAQELVVEKADNTRAIYPAWQWEITVRERVHLGLPADPALATNTIAPAGESPLVTFQLPP